MIATSCPFCGDIASIIRRGYNRCGTQRLFCKVCQKRFTPNPAKRSLSEEKQELIEKAFAERISQCGIARTFRVSRDTIRALRKKVCTDRRGRFASNKEPPVDDFVDYDEICARKSPGLWLWLAIARETRMVLDFVLSVRGNASFLRLHEEEAPPAYWDLKSFSDGLEAYRRFLPEGQHEICTKGNAVKDPP